MKLFLMFAMFVGLSVMGSLLLKTGAVMTLGSASWFQLQNWRLALGLFSLASAAVIYIFILQRVPLNVAQSFAAIQFVGVILGSSFMLSEEINAIQWTGIAFIACGIAIVGWSHG